MLQEVNQSKLVQMCCFCHSLLLVIKLSTVKQDVAVKNLAGVLARSWLEYTLVVIICHFSGATHVSANLHGLPMVFVCMQTRVRAYMWRVRRLAI